MKFIAWINSFQSSIVYITKHKKINTYFIPSKVCFAAKNVPLDIEKIISCEKDQICCFIISPVVWYVLCKSCSRKLVNDFDTCQSGANRFPGFGGQGSYGAACMIFCISVGSSSTTSWSIFSLLIKQADKTPEWDVIDVCNNNLWCIFVIGKN